MDMPAFYDDKAELTDDARSTNPFPPIRAQKQAATTVATADSQVGLHWESCTYLPPSIPKVCKSLTLAVVSIQPFRSEIKLIIAHYLTPSSPRELNISHRDRTTILPALQHTTHPSALSPIQCLVADTLRGRSHPNFVRWSLCNGNRPRVFFLRAFATWWLFVACACWVVLILSDRSRWIRVAIAPILWFGTTNMIAAAQGLCVLLHRRHTREVRPWELLPDEKVALVSDAAPPGSAATTSYPEPGTVEKGFSQPQSSKRSRLRALGPANDFRGEPWVERWRRTCWLRRLALRKVRVRDEALRVMQSRLVIQAELWSLLVTVPIVAGVVACPVVGLY